MLVLPLNDRHDRKSFDYGDVDLNGWLKQTARQHKEKGVSSTFVSVTSETSVEILGFYAISLAELVNAELPAQYGKRLPNKVPVFRLGRLATALGHQGKALGSSCSLMPLTERLVFPVRLVVLALSSMRSTPQSIFINAMALSRWETIPKICSCRFNSTPAQSLAAGGFSRLRDTGQKG